MFLTGFVNAHSTIACYDLLDSTIAPHFALFRCTFCIPKGFVRREKTMIKKEKKNFDFFSFGDNDTLLHIGR